MASAGGSNGETINTALAPTSSACLARRIASEVLFDPAPAMTGTRPAASVTVISITSSCSSWDKVGDSPVVPLELTRVPPAVSAN